MLHIASGRFTKRTQPETTVKVYSNAVSVELKVNGVSQGSHTGMSGIFLWPDVTLTSGENRIEAHATREGKELKDECVWTYQP